VALEHREEQGTRHILKKDTKLLSRTLKRFLFHTTFVVCMVSLLFQVFYIVHTIMLVEDLHNHSV